MPLLKRSLGATTKQCCKSSTLAKCCCQNFFSPKRPQHVTAFLWEWQWLPVKHQIDFKIAWMASEVQHLGAVYLSDPVSVHEPGSLPAGGKRISTCSLHRRGEKPWGLQLNLHIWRSQPCFCPTLGTGSICAAKASTFGGFICLCKAHQNLKIV